MNNLAEHYQKLIEQDKIEAKTNKRILHERISANNLKMHYYYDKINELEKENRKLEKLKSEVIKNAK